MGPPRPLAHLRASRLREQHGHGNIDPHVRPVDQVEVTAIENSAAQVSAAQPDAPKAGTGQVSAGKGATGQVCVRKVCLCQPQTGKGHAAQVRGPQRDVGPVTSLDGERP